MNNVIASEIMDRNEVREEYERKVCEILKREKVLVMYLRCSKRQ